MELAIKGGKPVREKLFPAHRFIGDEEKAAVNRVMDSGVLSRYLGACHPDFLGGPEVRALEEEWADYFGAAHALAVNSCTSGLIAAAGAAGLEPGDEVIVAPYSMAISATTPLFYHALPVFADVERDYYCLDAASVAARITPRTKAIIVVDLMGQPYDREGINALAAKHGLTVIEDAAQAPGARLDGRFAATLGHVGVHSLNYHKHIHCGEGGMVLTDDDTLAERVRLIRNHAESVVEGRGVTDISNMLGHNFRLSELHAAVARCQLRKLADLVAKRREHCQYLESRLAGLPALIPPKVRPGGEHAYYLHGYRFDARAAGVHRNAFIDAVKAELPCTELRETEGVKVGAGYVRPIYLLPLFQRRKLYATRPEPFEGGRGDYAKGICPVVESLHEDELFYHELMQPQMTRQDLDDVARAFEKVWDLRARLS